MDNWELILLDRTPLHLRLEDDFLEEQKQQCVIGTFLHNANAMEDYLSGCGKANTLMERYFALFPPAQMEKLVEFASQQLALRGKHPTNAMELRKNILLTWTQKLYNFSSKLLWTNELAEASTKHRFSIPSHERYIDVMLSVRGFPVHNRKGDHDDIWHQPKTTFTRMRDLEKELFEPSLILLNRKGGSIVFDDELIASRSRDVERKTLSTRKRGKEGPVVDCVADSADNKVFGVRIRAKGESDLDNLTKLMDTLPDMVSNEQSLDSHIYRGYGKNPVIEKIGEKKYSVLTMAAAMGMCFDFFYCLFN